MGASMWPVSMTEVSMPVINGCRKQIKNKSVVGCRIYRSRPGMEIRGKPWRHEVSRRLQQYLCRGFHHIEQRNNSV